MLRSLVGSEMCIRDRASIVTGKCPKLANTGQQELLVDEMIPSMRHKDWGRSGLPLTHLQPSLAGSVYISQLTPKRWLTFLFLSPFHAVWWREVLIFPNPYVSWKESSRPPTTPAAPYSPTLGICPLLSKLALNWVQLHLILILKLFLCLNACLLYTSPSPRDS